MRIGTLYGSSSVIFWYMWKRLPYFSLIVSSPSRLMASLKSRYTARPLSPTPRPRRTPAWRCATRRREARGCRSSGTCARGSSRARSSGIWSGGRLSPFCLRHPDAAVVAQALAHQRELRLMLAAHRNAGRVDLREARVGEERAALVRAPRRRDVGVHRVGRQVVGRAVAAGGENHGVAHVALDLAGRQVADDDAARLAVDEDEIEHLAPREEPDRALRAPGASATDRRRAGAAARSGRGRRTCATPARRRTSGCRAARRTRGRTARPAPRTGR